MRNIIIRDIRKKEKFQVDDSYLNGYARLVVPSVTSVYLSLCRHADINQTSFPSLKLIAEEHGITSKTVQRAIKRLTELNIIHFQRTRSKTGKWLNNTYLLLDKSIWKPTGHQRPMVQPQDILDQTTGHQRPTKDTHKKDTHIYNQHKADDNKKFSHISDILHLPKRGGSFEWQDYAVKMWGNLGLKDKPSASWFKLFKKAFISGRRGLLNATYSTVADINSNNPEFYFYKVFHQKLQKSIKPTKQIKTKVSIA